MSVVSIDERGSRATGIKDSRFGVVGGEPVGDSAPPLHGVGSERKNSRGLGDFTGWPDI